MPKVIKAKRSTGSDIRIGISGWRYPPWRGTFYPDELSQKNELTFASRAFNSIELNGSFYSLQLPSSYQTWYDQTPADFKFSIKGPRFITHMKQLKDVEKPLANFFASGVLLLKEKMGPILWQFPPRFIFKPEKIEAFFELLPTSTAQAAKIARGHESRMNSRAITSTKYSGEIRHAMEIRHSSFECAEFVELLRKYSVALVVADTAGKWPLLEDVTAPFIYARLHGDKELYSSGYSKKAIRDWAAKFSAWHAGKIPKNSKCISSKLLSEKSRDLFIYFDNDAKVHAPYNARQLAAQLGIGLKMPKVPELPISVTK